MNGTAAEKPEVFSVKWISRTTEHPASVCAEFVMISILMSVQEYVSEMNCRN